MLITLCAPYILGKEYCFIYSGRKVSIAIVHTIIEATDRQQRKMGHELHDGLCQQLTGIALLVQAMQRKTQTKSPVGKRDVDHVARLVQEALQHARRLAYRLRPVDPSPAGLAAALNSLAINTASLFGISCRFRCSRGIEILEPVVATHLYRIAQEWVTHAAQSAIATKILISLSQGRKGIVIKICDNGAHRTPDKYVGKIVLEMTRHRAELIGASIVIQKRKQGGTQLTCKPGNSKGTYENYGQSKSNPFFE